MTLTTMSRFLCIALLLSSFLLSGCGHPQIGESDEAFKEVEALYTAVTSKRKDLLEDSRKRFTKLATDGEISSQAMKSLTPIMDEAAKESWLPAATKLYDFMRAQRRESKR
jgi:uncharacterized protein with gpF-like domain